MHRQMDLESKMPLTVPCQEQISGPALKGCHCAGHEASHWSRLQRPECSQLHAHIHTHTQSHALQICTSICITTHNQHTHTHTHPRHTHMSTYIHRHAHIPQTCTHIHLSDPTTCTTGKGLSWWGCIGGPGFTEPH